jgi:hypothetical protein
MVFNVTFNNISVILCRSGLLVESTQRMHRPAESHWQTSKLHNTCACLSFTDLRILLKPSAVLAHGHIGQLSEGPILIYICCVRHISSCLNTGFVRSSNSMNIHACLILSTICIFIHVSGCLGIKLFSVLPIKVKKIIQRLIFCNIIIFC